MFLLLQHKNLDPALLVSDSVQKQAEQVVQEVVKEVYGPFFNEEVRQGASYMYTCILRLSVI